MDTSDHRDSPLFQQLMRLRDAEPVFHEMGLRVEHDVDGMCVASATINGVLCVGQGATDSAAIKALAEKVREVEFGA